MHSMPVRESAIGLREGLLDVSLSKAEFPIFDHHPDLHYLDSAATTQKPRSVIDAIRLCYEQNCAPINRGLYPLASSATQRFEQARATIASFINAPQSSQCIFTRSATESINLIASGWAQARLNAGDEIWVSAMEHHANYLPWQRVCRKTGATLRVIPVTDSGELCLIDEQSLFSRKVKLICISHVSNVLGTVNPISQIARKARQHGIPILLDACQSVGHMPVDVQALDCAFMAFSAHKMYGPDGVGVLYGKQNFLEQCEPLLLGGGMVDKLSTDPDVPITLQDNFWSELPQRLEAGSPNLTGATGMAAAAKYLQSVGLSNLHSHVSILAQCARTLLNEIDAVKVLGLSEKTEPGTGKEAGSGIVSFVVDGVHPHDVAQVAADCNVAIRAGHHCAQPLMQALDLPSTARASFAAYNTEEDVIALVSAVQSALSLFGRAGN